MNGRARSQLVGLVRRLAEDPALRLVPDEGDFYAIPDSKGSRISKRLAELLLSSGLLQSRGAGQLGVGPEAAAWLKRQSHPELPFRAQHHSIGPRSVPGEKGPSPLANLDESPVAALARRAGRDGQPWLRPHAVAAAERLRRDFEIGGLQPRITANWSASVADGRRSGDGSGLTDLTEMAIGARGRFDRAMSAVGPELSGVLVDICCFLKGLEEVERERQWPARSAKLVLRLALEALARHYGLSAAATGKAASGRVRHWGADDYRPKVS